MSSGASSLREASSKSRSRTDTESSRRHTTDSRRQCALRPCTRVSYKMARSTNSIALSSASPRATQLRWILGCAAALTVPRPGAATRHPRSQVKMMLSTTWEALDHAGLDQTKLHNSNTGVFVGMQGGALPGSNHGASLNDIPNNEGSMVPNRISYHFNWMGPSMAVGCACASAMTALDMSVRSLATGECDLVASGSVNYLTEKVSVGFTQMGVISKTGTCRSFDADANGYMRAEGAFVYLLKRLSDAERDGDRICAVIRAIGLNTAGAEPGADVLTQGRTILAPVRRTCRTPDATPRSVCVRWPCRTAPPCARLPRLTHGCAGAGGERTGGSDAPRCAACGDRAGRCRLLRGARDRNDRRRRDRRKRHRARVWIVDAPGAAAAGVAALQRGAHGGGVLRVIPSQGAPHDGASALCADLTQSPRAQPQDSVDRGQIARADDHGALPRAGAAGARWHQFIRLRWLERPLHDRRVSSASNVHQRRGRPLSSCLLARALVRKVRRRVGRGRATPRCLSWQRGRQRRHAHPCR